MSQIELFLLGKPRIKKSDGLTRSISDSQPSLLLMYLATSPEKHHVSTLNEIFQKQLKKIRYELSRESQKLAGLEFDDLFQQETNEKRHALSLQINSNRVGYTDIFVFEELIQEWSRSGTNKWTANGLTLLEDAMDIYGGAFAEDISSNFSPYNHWLELERNTYRHLASWTMLQLMFAGWSNASLSLSRNYGEHWLQKDPMCHLWTAWISYFLMCIAYWHNQPDRALAIYADYENRLEMQEARYPHNKDIARWSNMDNLVEQIREGSLPPPPETVSDWQNLQSQLGIDIPPSLTSHIVAEPAPFAIHDENSPSIIAVDSPSSDDLINLLSRMGFGSQVEIDLARTLRNREAILEQVRRFWIEGYLNTTLADVPNIDLQMSTHHEAVASLNSIFPDLSNTPPESYTFRQIDRQFETYNRKLLILGEPGAGKTTILLYLTHYLLQRAEADLAQAIPIVFTLASWSGQEIRLEDWLIEELNNKYHVSQKIATHWIETDALILLFDGLDEVAIEQQEACLNAINSFRARHGLVDMAISCRNEDYARIGERLKLNGALLIRSLSDQQIEAFLDEAEGLTTGMMGFIDDNQMVQELFRSPLVLNLLVRAFRKDEAGNAYEDIRVSDEHLFSHYVSRMYQRRSGQKSYTFDETVHYLSQLAHHMESHSQQVLHIELIQPSWLSKRNKEIFHHTMWIGSGIIATLFSFLGSTLGSFLSSTNPEIRPLESAFMWIPLMWLFFTKKQIWRKPIANFIPGITGAIGVFLHFYLVIGIQDSTIFDMASAFIRYSSMSFITAVMFALLQNRTDRINPSEKLVFSIGKANWRGAIFGFIAGLMLNLLYSLPHTNILSLSAIAGMGVSALIMSMTVFLITGFTRTDVPHRIVPNQGIRASGNNALKISLFSFVFGIGLLIGLSLSTEMDYALWRGIVLSFFLLYPIWFVYGGLAVQQHYLLRFMLEQESVLPRELQDFLDFASSLILMRRIGGGYTFVHKSLQEYFSRQIDN